jgi:regulator of sigma E protease
LFGFNDRHGTRWKVSAVPLGGYVKFFGDENAASVPDQSAVAGMTAEERGQTFNEQRVGPRAAIVVAGPLANFLLAVVIFAGLFMMFGKPSTSARVDSVQPESAASAAGFRPGDLVLSINGRRIDSFPDMQQIVSTSAGQALVFEVDRGGTVVTLKATPALKEVKDRFGNVNRQGILGITRSNSPDDTHFQPVGPLQAVGLGVQRTWFVVERTLSYIGGVISGARPPINWGGPSVSPRSQVRWRRRGSPLCSALRPSCRCRSDCSTCFRCLCSTAVTLCSTQSRRSGESRYRNERRKWGFGSGSRSFSCS